MLRDDRNMSPTRISRSPEGGFEIRWDGGGLIVPLATARTWCRFMLSVGCSARAMLRAYSDGVLYRCGSCNHSWVDLGARQPAEETFCPKCGVLQDVEVLENTAAVSEAGR